MSWQERVNKTADAALTEFKILKTKYDFIEEGRKNFKEHLDEAEKLGANIQDMMCFVWYTNNEEENNRLTDR